MQQVELENGQSATLRDPATLTNGQRRPIVLASDRYRKAHLEPLVVRELQRAVAQKDEQRQSDLLAAIALGADDETETLRVGEVAITVLVESWTLDLPLPIDNPTLDDDGNIIGSKVLDDLTAWDYDRLQRAAGRLVPDLRWTEPPAPKEQPSRRSRKR